MTDAARREELAELTGGLRCRCPGFSEMIRVECRGINGVRYCYFACTDPGNPQGEIRHPVGEEGLCRCSLGDRADTVSTRFFEDEEAVWGFSRCLALLPEPPAVPRPKQGTSFWPVAILLGGLLAYTTHLARK